MVTLKGHMLELQSLNELYKPYSVEVSDILEIWSYYELHTRTLPEKQSELAEVKGLLQGMKKDIAGLLNAR